MPRRQRKSSRIAVVVVTSACLVVGDQWFLARARGEDGKSNPRERSHDQKKMEKRGKVEGPRSPEGIGRWGDIEKAKRGVRRVGGFVRATCERSKVWEGGREGYFDVKGMWTERVESALARYRFYLLVSQAKLPPPRLSRLSLFLPLSLLPSHSRARGTALLDNKLYSTSTGTVLRTTGSPSSPSPRWHHR